MKKITVFLFTLVLSLIALVGCDEEKEPTPVPPTDGPTEVVPPVETPTPVPTPTPEPVVGTHKDLVVDYTNLAIYVPAGRSLKVLQFADLHFGVEGKNWHNDKIDRTKAYMQQVVDSAQADLIVCSGDNILDTGKTGLNEFIAMMESYKTPWTFIYGNHDSESNNGGHTKKELSEALLNADTTYLLYKEEYIEQKQGYVNQRYGNFGISVYEKDTNKLMGAYIFMDAGTYDYSASKYQPITEGQVAWYEEKIAALQAEYTSEGVVPTILFSHIQLPKFKELYLNAKDNKSGYEFVIPQELGDSEIDEILTGGPSEDNGFYDVLLETGSTKGYFVGHAHSFNWQVKVSGDKGDIVFGFAPQAGFSKLFETNDDPRQTYYYTVDPTNFSFTTTAIDEVVDLGSGLAVQYFDGNNGDTVYYATYDETTKIYTIELTYQKQWARARFVYNNVALTPSNTTMTGAFSNAYDGKNIYPGSNPANLYYPKGGAATYTFVYNPETNTLTITEPAKEELTDTVVAKDVNNDSALTVWTQAGTEIYDGSKWVGNGWRLYVVVDAEGKVAYMVIYPPNGYGGAYASSYVRHSDYSDYTTNPAFSYLSEPYEGKWGMTCDFKVAVPEGGFVITAHNNDGEVDALVKLILGLTTYSDKVVNTKNNNVDNIRITFDSTSKKIKIVTVE